ncbi:Swarming motility regulation sensor protein RssA [Pandoraea cepalis]|uniref:histidine kinase n=1 Tax=Pandoraea cepalis TaxID=2508294 RepID=A0A5E4XHG8_9BURK|nr:sensor histidine kinase [Pandoraea cepalis]VVE35851.1 Swarming motility regulation sensor protein RssA [Pandoraea cepalis]
MLSLRVRLLMWLMLPLTLYIGASGWQAYRSARDTAALVQDRALLTSAQVIAGELTWVDGALRASVPPSALELFASPARDRVFYQVVTEDGQLLAGPPDFPRPPLFSGTTPAYFSVTVNGEPLRAVNYVRTMYNAGTPYQVAVVVAETMHAHDAMLSQLWEPSLHRQIAMAALAALLVLIGLTVELHPLIRLKDEVAGRAPQELVPIRAGQLQTELRPIVDAINLCIQRLSAQAQQQRRFVADAAHQLRTPLTLLDTQLQFAAQLDDRAALADVLAAMQTSSRGLADLTNKLLLLSQAEAADTPAFSRSRVDLVAVAAAVLEELVALAQRRHIDLGLETTEAHVWVEGNGELFHAMVMNLVDNAIRYIHEGGRVTVAIDSPQDMARLRVIDDGPGIQAEARQRVFERFYRNAPPGQPGTGLGLAIVKEIVAASYGTVTLASGDDGRGLMVTVTLPLAIEAERNAL